MSIEITTDRTRMDLATIHAHMELTRKDAYR